MQFNRNKQIKLVASKKFPSGQVPNTRPNLGHKPVFRHTCLAITQPFLVNFDNILGGANCIKVYPWGQIAKYTYTLIIDTL